MKRILARAMLAAATSLATLPLAAQDVDQRIAANIQDWVPNVSVPASTPGAFDTRERNVRLRRRRFEETRI